MAIAERAAVISGLAVVDMRAYWLTIDNINTGRSSLHSALLGEAATEQIVEGLPLSTNLKVRGDYLYWFERTSSDSAIVSMNGRTRERRVLLSVPGQSSDMIVGHNQLFWTTDWRDGKWGDIWVVNLGDDMTPRLLLKDQANPRLIHGGDGWVAWLTSEDRTGGTPSMVHVFRERDNTTETVAKIEVPVVVGVANEHTVYWTSNWPGFIYSMEIEHGAVSQIAATVLPEALAESGELVYWSEENTHDAHERAFGTSPRRIIAARHCCSDGPLACQGH